jgi:hypothetical protein
MALSRSKFNTALIGMGGELFDEARKRASERAKIAHVVWAAVDIKDEYILLIKHADYLQRLGNLFRFPYLKDDGTTDSSNYPFVGLEGQSYTMRDIRTIWERIHALTRKFVIFGDDVLAATNTKPLPFIRERDLMNAINEFKSKDEDWIQTKAPRGSRLADRPLGPAPICSRGGGASDFTSGRADTRRGSRCTMRSGGYLGVPGNWAGGPGLRL